MKVSDEIHVSFVEVHEKGPFPACIEYSAGLSRERVLDCLERSVN
jgi:hypothetical protein